ncbi:unnamed protein product [Prunus armeniaca]
MRANSRKGPDDKAPMPCVFQEPMTAPRHMQDGSTAVAEQLETIDLSEDPSTPRPISVSVHLTNKEKEAMVSLLKEFRDVFAWSYKEMSGLNPNLVSHTLNIELGTKLITLPRRNFHPEIEKQIKVEIEKLLAAGFIKPIKHPTWLANIVPVKKKTEIKMSPKDAEKTAFRKPYDNFYCTVMPYGLKNAGATYQRAMTAVFHNMMGKEVEDYVDDLVVKSKTRESHQEVLRRVLERCRLYGLKMNPKKCLAASMSVFTPLLKKGKPYKWSKECQEAYQQVQQIITKLPTMRAPISRLPLKLYLAATSTAVGALLAQDDHRLRHYFLAHKLHLIVKSDPEVMGELPEMVAVVTEAEPWTLYFDGSSTSKDGGAGVVLINPEGQATTLLFKLNFPCTNNTAEYEAFIMGMSTAREMGVERIKIIGESNLVLSQLQGNFAVKEPTLVPYRTAAERLVRSFKQVVLEHIPGVTNRYADALATLGSKLSFVEEQPNIAVIKKDMPVIEAMAQEEQLEEDDWRKPVKEKIGKGSDIKELKDYAIIFGELYRLLLGGILTRCIGTTEARRKLQEVHEVTCNLEPIISLYRRLQCKGYYWPEMRKEAAEMQANCPKCATIPSTEESFTISFTEDWRAPHLASFINGVLPTNPKHARKLKRTMKRYFINGSTLYRKGFNGEPLKCLGKSEAQQVMQEIHAGECSEHQGMKKLYQQLLSVGYYWPTMKNDAYNFVKKCHTCQVHANLRLDLIGIIHPPSDGYIWIHTATEYFTKWVEAVPLRKATGAAVANFICEYIQVSSTLSGYGVYGVKHCRSTPYYPQGNGQAEATNKTLLRILSKMVYEYEGGWSVHLPDALWAYRTSSRSATGFSPYSLVYGFDAISPVEITIPTARVAAVNDLEWDTKSCLEWRLLDLEALDEKRTEAERRTTLYHKVVA